VNYQQDKYNDKKHTTTGYTLFKLNFEKHLWKENLIVKIELPKLEIFLKGLQISWKIAKKVNKNGKRSYEKVV